MPLDKGSSKEECISTNYKKEIAAGKSNEQARAIALSFCDKKYEVSEEVLELMFLSLDIEIATDGINALKAEIENEKSRIKKLIGDIIE